MDNFLIQQNKLNLNLDFGINPNKKQDLLKNSF